MNLHDRLDDLAGEMAGTDLAGLRQRVDRTSRRLRMRRTPRPPGWRWRWP
ncbi:hypothetical protein [Dactylosporangium sp. NPDC050588]